MCPAGAPGGAGAGVGAAVAPGAEAHPETSSRISQARASASGRGSRSPGASRASQHLVPGSKQDPRGRPARVDHLSPIRNDARRPRRRARAPPARARRAKVEASTTPAAAGAGGDVAEARGRTGQRATKIQVRRGSLRLPELICRAREAE